MQNLTKRVDEYDLYPIDVQNTGENQIIAQLMEQMSTIGFCLITNVEGFDEEKLLKPIKAFYELPIEKKLETTPHHLNPENDHIHYGYFPFIEGDVSHKEFFSMPRPFSDYSEWEKSGCKLYEELTWIRNDTEHRWILDEFGNTF